MRTEDGATACPLRSTDGTLTSTTGALLTPWLLTATANLTARERVVRACTARCAL